MLSLLIYLIALGLLAWLVSFIPMPSPFKEIIQVLFVIIAIVVVIQFLFGITIIPGLHAIPLR